MTRSETSDDREVPPWAAGATQRMHELDPELDDAEIEVLRGYGQERHYAKGESLWEAGDRGTFMLVLDGGIDVINRTDKGEQVIISHGPRHYIGEIVTMSGGRALVSGRAREDLRALVVDSDDVRRLIATESDLGEKILLSFILRRMRMVAERLSDVLLIGDFRLATTNRLEGFLSRNGIPFDTLDSLRDERAAMRALEAHAADANALPAVVVNGTLLSRPDNRTLAEQLGFTIGIDCGATYDVAVVGSGPAGMTAAVYAASEGLSVIVLESCAPGGQAASSSKIENYMGFPTGITGQALMGRAYLQAQKFGAQIAVARELVAFECGSPWHTLCVDGGDRVRARAMVLASGAIYREPPIEGLADMGGVHYGASHVEGELCRGRDIAVIGGGNSAGQAAVFLSKRARQVHILIRGRDLSHSMSDYLIRRIERTPNVTLHPFTEVERLLGDDHLRGVTVRDNRSGAAHQIDLSHLFVFIGAQPGTAFLDGQMALDEKGFVLTGDAIDETALERTGWPLERRPYLLETSCPRVFAAGDVRSGSIKRVASAVGEGSACIQFVHRVLAEEEEDRQ